jgi:spore maturation protein CgeB
MPVHLDFTDLARFECDVVFIGHFERDGRVEYLRALVEAGLHVRLFGTGWDSKKLGNLGQYFGEVTPLRGTEYRKALVASRLALCFLSRLNRDEYTRRCFEIPACGAVLLSERTTALERLFEDGREAVYFSSEVELVGRVKQLLLEPGRLSEIRTAGFERVRRDGHSVYDRMKEMLNIIHMEKLR